MTKLLPLAAAIAMTIGTAHAADSTATTSQNGSGNIASTVQTGTNHTATINTALGFDSSATIDQAGDAQTATINQIGGVANSSAMVDRKSVV